MTSRYILLYETLLFI